MKIRCDRCGQDKDGFVEPEGMSAGFYVGWTDFMDEGEHVICDACMWEDPRYRAVYGVHS